MTEAITPLTDVMELATTIHDITCKIDHKDQCSWYQEEESSDLWSQAAHDLFLQRAFRMIVNTGLAPNVIADVLREL